MKRLMLAESGLTKSEYTTLARLTTPIKIQDFLDTFPFNMEKKGATYMSPRRSLREKKAHCIEGALIAAAALWIAGEPPLIMNLSPLDNKNDTDHVVALYKRSGYCGAISKTNHACLRFRDPIYRTPRELALSYFHEWFIDATSEKVLERYSKPLDLRRLGTGWLTTEENLQEIADALDETPHYDLVPKGNWRFVRKVDLMEHKVGTIVEWKS